ncbi:bifunctional adenosylcobinamide kinase/adenosylcobinamide-phosphate guanylyltransferase [Sporolactobacillus sp. THM19-2]|uniref:bifunctional adenosylcobinamide kinase/adenosylcobinamide-phosphate guanylyltransferase n=1 Tax=Sporolactobacillus sp. THM19-2 TaxID=2511171 RepID=UPI0010216661|nr:bifunctional adenosylcobinamide kinase/adenosylcobinamide-phosphate guanylyltransferase [Sporolactobacillus sp. THM19-2]RYL88136.1 hypothetical protein EWH91_11860 [Sporolactobacillus sp. THM19-2]
MHFVTGGAFNGKTEWVKNFYHHPGESDFDVVSACALSDPAAGPDLSQSENLMIVGMEQWVRKELTKNHADQVRSLFNARLESWSQWEKEEASRKLVIIGTDITKGIVPVDKNDRLWRDVTGWVFQDIAKRADRVDVIWYGLNQRLK